MEDVERLNQQDAERGEVQRFKINASARAFKWVDWAVRASVHANVEHGPRAS